MGFTADIINNVCIEELNRLMEIDMSTPEGREHGMAELERAKAVRSTSLTMIENQNAAVNAMMALREMRGNMVEIPLPKMLSGDCDA